MLRLVSAQVWKYKSIEDSTLVTTSPNVTVMVGQNESGKTAFLEALYKSNPVEACKFEYELDYPRKDLFSYQQEHEKRPAVVTTLTFQVDGEVLKDINEDLFYGEEGIKPFAFSYSKKYDNKASIGLKLDEKHYIASCAKHFKDVDGAKEFFVHKNLEEICAAITAAVLDPESKLAKFGNEWDVRIKAQKAALWPDTLDHYVWATYLSPNMPKFLYFDEYKNLPGKINLPTLQQAVANKVISDEQNTALGLLELAGVGLADLLSAAGYEQYKAKLEAISNSISDQVFEYWKQNSDLEVEFDIQDDPKAPAPFNSGKNLYIRIKNRKHRVTVPFDQRSKGFIWFFSFMVWFESVKNRIKTDKDLIILLDEPGLNLHAMAQQDLLRYIDSLAENHQIIYTTHSPFMVESSRLQDVKVVEDKPKVGTKITGDLAGSDKKSLFPLQAALGYDIAQNLFIGKHNLLVEGPADLLYLQFFSRILEEQGRQTLPEDIVIVPVGGLDKLATFIALLGGNKLEMVVLHDKQSRPHLKLQDMARMKIIHEKRLLNYGMFSGAEEAESEADVEDLLPLNVYLAAFNKTYAKELGKTKLAADKLPEGKRVVDRINRFLKDNNLTIRGDGDFNHFRVATTFIALHPDVKDEAWNASIDAFEALFRKTSELF